MRILHLEDDPADAELIREALQAEGIAPEIMIVQTEADYLAQLDQGWDIILVDYNLPQFDGLKALKLLKERELDLSVILISGTIGEEVAVVAMRAGASDYIMKDNLARLGPAIERGLQETIERRERKQSAEALVRRAQEWHTTFNASNDGIWLLDREHRIVRSNKQADRLFPSSTREGKTRCWEIVHGTTGPIADCPAVRAKESLQRETMELQIGDFWYQVTVDPILNADGKYTGAVHVLRDITKDKQAEAEQRKTEDQLQQALKMDSVGRLAGGVAHDFNNMLQVILGYTDMALNETDPETSLYKDLIESRKAANRAADLTRQLLAFARKQTMTPKVLDLNETVSGMLMMLRRLIGENIDLIWQPTAADATVKMDPSQIDQILANLCVNARDAIDGVGTLKVEIGTLTATADLCAMNTDLVPGEYVTLSVSDTGCGMDTEMIKHIFEPFYTTKDIGKGTGLGLSTVYGIVKQNNGCINITSVPEKGTIFWIYLPRHLGEAVQLPTSGPTQVTPRGHDTVLLVEDEPSILTMGKRMLEDLNYRVLTASIPDEAIALAEEHSGEIHLLLTDVVMPQMNGLDLADRLSLLYPKIKHMFMSGYTADIIAKQGLIEEGVHFIHKPFSIEELAVKVREVLD